MNTLFIVTELFSANGNCIQALMKEMIDDGHTVYCLTNSEHGLEECYELFGATIYTVKPRWTYVFKKFTERMRPGTTQCFLSRIWWLLNKIRLVFAIPTWPLISPLYSLRYLIKAKDIHGRKKLDVVVPVYSQIDTIIAANYLKKKDHSVTVVPYLLDSFSGGYGPKMFSDAWIRRRGIRWERRLFKSVDAILAMNSSKNHYLDIGKTETYVRKMRFLDIPLFIPSTISNTCQRRTDRITLLYLGAVKRGIRSANFLVQVLRMLNDIPLELYFYGTDIEELKTMIPEMEKTIWLRILPAVKPEAARELMQQADFLVNLGNENSNMVPSKVFEYMSTGKPIISTMPTKTEPSQEYLRKYPASCVLDESNSVEENAKQLKDFLQKRHEMIDAASLKATFYLNTPRAFINELQEITE